MLPPCESDSQLFWMLDNLISLLRMKQEKGIDLNCLYWQWNVSKITRKISINEYYKNVSNYNWAIDN